MNRHHDKQYVFQKTLRKVYGLTTKIIAELDPPDKTVDNSHYANAAAASLYRVERVEHWIEKNQERLANGFLEVMRLQLRCPVLLVPRGINFQNKAAYVGFPFVEPPEPPPASPPS